MAISKSEFDFNPLQTPALRGVTSVIGDIADGTPEQQDAAWQVVRGFGGIINLERAARGLTNNPKNRKFPACGRVNSRK